MKTINTTLVKSLLVVVLIIGYSKSFAQEILTNQSIITISNAKVSKDLIIDKIKASQTNFKLNTAGIIELATAKINDQIIDAMLLSSSDLPIMRNQDVIDLYLGKVSREIITKKIQYSESDFSTTIEAMVELKLAKIPDQLQKVMINPGRATKQSSNPNLIAGLLAPHPVDLPPPSKSAFPENGIYYEEYKTKTRYEQLEPTTTNRTKSGSVGETVAKQATGGLTSISQKVGLTNPSANFVIEDNRPVFYFVFSGDTRKNMNEVAENIFEGVASPNDFTLLKVKPNYKGRQFVIGKSSDYTSETGFGDGALPFRFKKITNSIYKVFFEQDIPAAEYAFFYNKGSEFTSSLKLYDFSLKNNVK